jgi:hypothetical protein
VNWLNKPSSSTFTNDPFFLSLRMSEARDSCAGKFKRPPEAFAAAPGGFVAEYVPLAKALGFKWLAAGPLASTAPFNSLNADGVALVPFSIPPAGAAGGTAPEFLVFDETSGRPGPDTRAALIDFISNPARPQLTTVTEALAASVSASVTAAEAARLVTPWSGDYTPWAGLPIQAGTLTAFARTRGELMAHYNAKQADYKAASAAFSEYFSVESGPKLLKLADPDPDAAKETEIEIENALVNTYRLMDKVPPGWLFSSLAAINEDQEEGDKVSVRKSTAGFTLLNAARLPVPPVSTAQAGQDPYRAWKLARVEVSWTDAEIVFAFIPQAPPAGAALQGMRFDLYIDVNNRPRAGAVRMLEGSAGRIFPDNAWEYALDASPKRSALYAATGKGPQKAGDFQADIGNGGLTVRIPRTVLRGNPGLWGYAAFMLYTSNDKVFQLTDFLAEDYSNGYYYSVRPSKK